MEWKRVRHNWMTNTLIFIWLYLVKYLCENQVGLFEMERYKNTSGKTSLLIIATLHSLNCLKLNSSSQFCTQVYPVLHPNCPSHKKKELETVSLPYFQFLPFCHHSPSYLTSDFSVLYLTPSHLPSYHKSPNSSKSVGKLFSLFHHKASQHRVSEVVLSYPTLCDPMDCSPPGSSVHGILQARIPEWVAISFSRGSSRPRDQTQVSRIAGRRFILWPTGKPHTEGLLKYPTTPKEGILAQKMILSTKELLQDPIGAI